MQTRATQAPEGAAIDAAKIADAAAVGLRSGEHEGALLTARQQQQQRQLALQHAPLVKRIAWHLSSRLPQTQEVEDLMQAGMVGLLEAASRFDPEQGASFESFAAIRIRGAIIDQTRPCEWTPRAVLRTGRVLSAATQRVEHREGREARATEVMAEVGMDADTYNRAQRDIACSRMLDLATVLEHGDSAGGELPTAPGQPDDGLHCEQFRAAFANAVRSLSERRQQVLALYYDEELNMREIGEVLGVTESRVCQVHTQCIDQLRELLADWQGEALDARMLSEVA